MKKFLPLLLIFSCTMAPSYKRPESPVVLRKNDEAEAQISKISWEKFFVSPDLQRVIKLALENNRDLKVAELNIEQAKASYASAIADLFPSIDAKSSKTRQKLSPHLYPSSAIFPRNQYAANLTVTAFELDFFGRLQSLKNAARESYFATMEARNVVKVMLITETANTYATLLYNAEMLDLSEKILQAKESQLKFLQMRYEHGINSKADLLEATSSLETSRQTRDSYKKLFEQSKNSLMTLCGKFDEKILPKNLSLEEVSVDENLLESLPSQTLLFRPDIKQAEYNLKSANANIGAARAAFFPSISLTTNVGFASRESQNLFSSNSQTWAFTPQVSLPIFHGGDNFANLKIANVRKKIEILNYERAIQNAFKEALDGLAAREALSSQMKSAKSILSSKAEIFSMSQKKYEVGLDSKFSALTNEQNFFIAKQNYLGTKQQQLSNLISLYKILGGGSEQTALEAKN